MEFEWDFSKEVENIIKHDVDFTEASECFFDVNGFRLIDRKHSKKEERYYWVGRLKGGRILTTRYTQRGQKIRIFGSAEWRKFRRLYHERTKTK
ncbi:MAG: BrnT family toxin [Deltaproteobacteria bacterium]|nr:BrnT family toxin [Deltaproteobacteria bacterium]